MTNRRVVSGLQPAHRYSMRVRALSKFGVASDWSEALDFATPGDDSIPSAPENLVVDFTSPDLTLQWDPVDSNTDGTPIVDFSHYRVVLTVPEGGSVSFNTTQAFFMYSFAQNVRDFDPPSPEFNVNIRAVDVSGKESASLVGNALNEVPSKPQDPTGVAAFTMMTVYMSPNSVDRDIREYFVERADDSGGPFDQVAVTSNGTYIDTGEPNTTKYFRFRVNDFFNQVSPYSEVLALTTEAMDIDTEPPEAVEDFAVAGVGIDPVTWRAYIDLTWTPNTVDDDLSHFELRATRNTDNFVRSVVIGPGASSYRLADLEEDTSYSLVIYAYDYMGNRSAASDILQVTTPVDDSAPQTPISAGVISSFRSLTVYWDTDFNPRFSHYEVYASTDSGFTPDTENHSNKVFSGNASRFVFSTEDNTTWYFRVRTVNNNQAASDFTDEFSGASPDGIQSNKPGEPSGAQFRVDSAGNMWIGDDDFESAPFSVSNVGSALMRNVIITGEDMDPGARIIDTPYFIVNSDGDVVAYSITATGGTIGGVTINDTNLSGGEIEGSTFNIGAGGINFTGSGKITWQDNALGGIELAHGGYINNQPYRQDSDTGFQINNDGVVINEGLIRSAALQIGVGSENLIVNSAFLDGNDVADHWTVESGSENQFSVSSENFQFGNASQKITMTQSSSMVDIAQSVVMPDGEPFPNEERLAFSFWARQTNGPARTAQVYVERLNQSSYDFFVDYPLIENLEGNVVTGEGVTPHDVTAPAGVGMQIVENSAHIDEFALEVVPGTTSFNLNRYISVKLSSDQVGIESIGFDISGDASFRIRSSQDSFSTDLVIESIVEESGQPDGLVLSGTSGGYASTPDNDWLDITEDIDIRVMCALDDWDATDAQGLIAKRQIGGFSYRLRMLSGQPSLVLSEDGSNEVIAIASIAVPFIDDEPGWVRATWRQLDGRVQFFTSDDGIDWVQLGDDEVIEIESIFISQSSLEIGSINNGTSNLVAGRIFTTEIRDGIDGTLVANPDFRSDGWIPGNTDLSSSDDTVGNQWTLHGDAIIAAAEVTAPGAVDYTFTVDLQRNEDLEIRIYPYTTNPGESVFISYIRFEGQSHIISSAPELVWDGTPGSLTVNGWVRFGAVFIPPSDSDVLRVHARILNPGVGDVFFIDGAQLEVADHLTPYKPRSLELPENYIQNAWISNLSADRLTSGTLGAHTIRLNGTESAIQSINWSDDEDIDLTGWRISGDGRAVFQNGSITVIGAGGVVSFDGSSFRANYGEDAGFFIDETGVYIGGTNETNADVMFRNNKTIFQSTAGASTFVIDTNPDDGKILKLLSGSEDSFYLDTDGQAYFRNGSIDGRVLDEGSVPGSSIDSLSVGQLTAGSLGIYGLSLDEEGRLVTGGMVLDAEGIRLYDLTGRTTIRLDAQTGRGEFSGAITSSEISIGSGDADDYPFNNFESQATGTFPTGWSSTVSDPLDYISIELK